jgi:hypothetical protein
MRRQLSFAFQKNPVTAIDWFHCLFGSEDSSGKGLGRVFAGTSLGQRPRPFIGTRLTLATQSRGACTGPLAHSLACAQKLPPRGQARACINNIGRPVFRARGRFDDNFSSVLMTGSRLNGGASSLVANRACRRVLYSVALGAERTSSTSTRRPDDESARCPDVGGAGNKRRRLPHFFPPWCVNKVPSLNGS